MSEEELLEIQDKAEANVLELMAYETDSEKLQQYGKTLESIVKGKNDRTKIELDYSINESKLLNEKQIAERKVAEEELNNEKQRNLERRKAILDGTVKVLTLVVSALGLGAAYWEDITSYTKNLETKREARNMLKNNK